MKYFYSSFNTIYLPTLAKALSLFLFFGWIFFFTNCNAQLIINEVQSFNTFTYPDEDLDYPDWIEFYNDSDDTLDITDYQLSDRITEIKWRFPATHIPPKSFITVFASGKNRAFPNLHSNFKLNAEGELLILTDPFSIIIDSVSLPQMAPNISFGRAESEENRWIQFYEPSPLKVNDGIEFNYIYTETNAGFYDDTVKVNINNNDIDSNVFYTLDGSDPNPNSLLYNGELAVYESTSNEESLMQIPTTPLDGPAYFDPLKWKAPEGVFDNATVLKFQSYKNDKANGPVITKTYFFENERGVNAFPVISLSMDEKHLFDLEEGIYIPGNRYLNDSLPWLNVYPNGNYLAIGEEWEKPAYIEYFDEFGQMGFGQNIGVRLKGLSSAALPQKSLNLYARNEYGKSRFEYPVFGPDKKESYKRLSLRNSGNDFLQTHFRDAVLQKLLKDLDLETQAFKRSLLYLNGEYWGIMNIREKYSKFYFQDYFGIDDWQLDLLENKLVIVEGDSLDLQSLLDFVEINSLEDVSNYEYIKSKIDLENFIDYHIAEIYFGNLDWPGNNVAFWRERKAEAKWRWLILDLDISFGFSKEPLEEFYESNLFDVLTDEESEMWPNPQWSTLLFRSLLKSKDFENLFIDRFVYHLKNTFEIGRVTTEILAFKELFEPQIEKHIRRWGHPKNRNIWNGEINSMIEFAEKRHCVLKEQLINFFDLQNISVLCYEDIFEQAPFIYPNPISSHFNIAIDSPDEAELQLEIFDLSGKIMFTQNLKAVSGANLFKIDNLKFLPGTYIVHIPAIQFKQKLVFVE